MNTSLTQSLSISVLRQQSMHPTIDILICNHLRDRRGLTEQVYKSACLQYVRSWQFAFHLRDRGVKISKEVEQKDIKKYQDTPLISPL